MNQKPELEQAFCLNAHLSGCLVVLLAVSTAVGVVVKLGRCGFIAFFFFKEMASNELKEIRKAMTKEAIREHQMAKTGGTQTDLFTCGKCKKKNCTYTQVGFPAPVAASAQDMICHGHELALLHVRPCSTAQILLLLDRKHSRLSKMYFCKCFCELV